MSELQAHHCMTPEQRSWLLCSVSVIPANKPSLEEINKLIGIELLISSFLENSGLALNDRFVSLCGRPLSPSKREAFFTHKYNSEQAI